MRSYTEALVHGEQEEGKSEEEPKYKAPALAKTSEDVRGNAIIAEDSNMNRCKGAVAERVRRMGGLKMVRTVIEGVKQKLWETQEGRNLVVISVGLNDVLRGDGGGVGKQTRKGVRSLRSTSDNVQIQVCTVPEVRGEGIHMERAVAAANQEIWRLEREMTFKLIDTN